MGAYGQPEQEMVPLNIEADTTEFSPDTGLLQGKGNVRVEYEGVVLTADEITLNQKTKDVSAQGNVVLKRGDVVWEGPSISGNFGTKDFAIGTFDVTAGPWYLDGANGHHFPDGHAVLGHTQLTTCELDHPHYSVNARKVVYYPDGRFRAYGAVIKVGGVPVFYWPVLFGDTSGTAGGVRIQPGYSSDWGAYLLLARSWRLGDLGETTMRLDFRTKNGIAVGNETNLKTENTETHFLVYGMHDSDPPETEDGYNRRFDVETTRYRLNAYHRYDIADGLTLRLNADVLSDIDMLEDWFKHEFDRDPQPRSFGDLTYEHERFTASLSARPRVNDFYTVVETLPEIRLEMPRQTIPGTPFYYQGTTTGGHYEMKWRDFDRERDGFFLEDPEDYDAWRFDTLHMFYRPFDIKDVVQVIPRAGFRITYYSDSSRQDITVHDLDAMFDVDNPDNPYTETEIPAQYDSQGGSVTRLAGELGLEVTTKLFRVWPDATNELLLVDGLRHVIQPYVNYTWAPDPTEDRDNLYFFDEVDRLQEQNFVRIGVDHRLQTHRNGRIYTLARMEHYADFHFTKERDANHWGDFGNRIHFYPREHMNIWGTIVTALGETDVNRGELGFRIGDPERLAVALAYLYRNEYLSRSAYSMGSTLVDWTGEAGLLQKTFEETHSIVASIGFPINEKTSARARVEYDFMQGEVALHSYQIIRDLHCWMGALEVGQDNGDFFIMLVLSLKAFPDIDISAGL
jgi:lipopolysaccharide assembly outer membrane protein LptD (OstA)